MAGNSSFHSDDDDDLLLELEVRPTKNVVDDSAVLAPTTQQLNSITTNNEDVALALNKAQGEASMLRDKINLLNIERERERQQKRELSDKLSAKFNKELENLRRDVQFLKDENKFLSLESKRLTSHGRHSKQAPTSAGNDSSATSVPANSSDLFNLHNNSSTIQTSPVVKKRKIGEPKLTRTTVTLNHTRVAPDEKSLLLENLMVHSLFEVEMTTIEILSKLKLDCISEFRYKSLRIRRGDSIGEKLLHLLHENKNRSTLDNFVDLLLEHLAALIKEISLHPEESNLAVPFLVVLMYQIMVFRPSAVHELALKDLFHFTTDLIKQYQHILKQPLHESPLELHVEPQIFQYQLIDTLVIFYSFDVLELTLRIVQLYPNKVIVEFLDQEVMGALESIYKLALSVSFKSVTNVVFNTVAILNLISSISISFSGSDTKLIKPQWWKDCITRLFNILNKSITNQSEFPTDEKILNLSKYHDCNSLIRNVGTNSIAKFIMQMVTSDSLISVPNVVSKDDIEDMTRTFTTSSELEAWFLYLKEEIISCLENLMIEYPDDKELINSELFIELTRLMAKEQQMMIERHVGQISACLELRCQLIQHSLTIIYKLWTSHRNNLKEDQLEQIENELTTALWRVLVTQVEPTNNDDESNYRNLISGFHEMTLKDDIMYFDDTMEEMPEFVANEINKQTNERCFKIMQVKYDKIHQEMARTILESRTDISTSIEDIDSLYTAMGL